MNFKYVSLASVNVPVVGVQCVWNETKGEGSDAWTHDESAVARASRTKKSPPGPASVGEVHSPQSARSKRTEAEFHHFQAGKVPADTCSVWKQFKILKGQGDGWRERTIGWRGHVIVWGRRRERRLLRVGVSMFL